MAHRRLVALFLCAVCISQTSAQTKQDPTVSSLAGQKFLRKTELNQLKFPSANPNVEKGRKSLALGLWLPKRTFRSDEPVHALFVLKNYSRNSQVLDMGLTLTSNESLVWNMAKVHLEAVNLKGSQQSRSEGAIWACGKPLAVIEGNSYQCFRGDLRRLVQPGSYKLRWNYGKLISREVTFEVLEGKESPSPLGTTHENQYWLTLLGEMKPVQIGPKPPKSEFDCKGIRRQSFAAISRSLAAGYGDRYYPDIHDLPTADEFMTVSAKIVKPKGKKSLALDVTLNPTANAKAYRLNDVRFSLALMVLPKPGVELLQRKGELEEPDKQGFGIDKRKSNSTPWKSLSFLVHLPDDWANKLYFHGPARCALVISSERIEDRSFLVQRLDKIWPKTKRLLPPRWKGVLRTPWMEINIRETMVENEK